MIEEEQQGCMPCAPNLLSPLIPVNKNINTVGPSDWTAIEVIVDSGACETVMPASMLTHIRLRPSAQSLAKLEYEVASGTTIPNLGERHCEVQTSGSKSSLLMHFQVADVHRPLLSLSKAADMGFRTYLDNEGGWLEDTESGECISIERKGDLYVMQIWVRAFEGNSGGDDNKAASTETPFARRG